MSEETNYTMERKVALRQSPCAKTNGAINEKKSDFLGNKNGRQKKYRDPSNGNRPQDVGQTPRPIPKHARGFGDKRPRQRGSLDYRQSQEIVEPFGLDVDLIKSRKAKGNANHLLNFSYQDRGYHRHYGGGGGSSSWGGKRIFRHHAPNYKKEQYLQASCQFVVQEDGDYLQQAIDPDALVDWDKVELVRTYSSEVVTCPICLDVPTAGKITPCGHTYCWGCILHYLQVNNSPKKDTICPVCPETIDADKLRSVQNVLVPDFKIGDEIEMKLMRKSKGSVFVCPEDEWSSTQKHLNIDVGKRSKFSKLLTASWTQVQEQVIEREKDAIKRALKDAEQEEICFLQMAQHLLEKREADMLLKGVQKVSVAKDISAKEDLKQEDDTCKTEAKSLASDASFDGSKIKCYTDAFDEEENMAEGDTTSDGLNEDASGLDISCFQDAFFEDNQDKVESETVLDEVEDGGMRASKDAASEGTPIQGIDKSLTPEEAADDLELPELASSPPAQQQRGDGGCRPKDTYHFYQASTGQHIYMHSLNARCLTKEYGSIEKSPRTIKATIVAIDRIFMTEEMRKRLRYLNHIPLTTEFHVVELKIKPPIISKETLKHFQYEFDKRRKLRQKKAKEEKIRASKSEVEHKKAHGIYVAPEIHIPLDNTAHFPSHLATSPDSIGRHRKESTNSDIFSDAGATGSDGQVSPITGSPVPDDLDGSPPFISFAQKLQGGFAAGSIGSSPPAWPRINSASLSHSSTMPEMRSGAWGQHHHHHHQNQHSPQQNEEGEDGSEAYHAPTMASSWMSSLHQIASEPTIQPKAENSTDSNNGGKKKKKKKEKQLLFSTSMARKT